MRFLCPHCFGKVAQRRNRTGPNFCPNCCRLFQGPRERSTARWVFGVLAILVLNLHVNLGLPAAVFSGAGI